MMDDVLIDPDSIFYVYFCQQLDKSSLSFASVFGLKDDAHLHGTEYSWLSSIVYFAQLVFQPRTCFSLGCSRIRTPS